MISPNEMVNNCHSLVLNEIDVADHGVPFGLIVAYHIIGVPGVWRSRVEHVCRVVYLWCTVCCCRCHLWRTLPYSVAPIVCIHLAGSPHI